MAGTATITRTQFKQLVEQTLLSYDHACSENHALSPLSRQQRADLRDVASGATLVARGSSYVGTVGCAAVQAGITQSGDVGVHFDAHSYKLFGATPSLLEIND